MVVEVEVAILQGWITIGLTVFGTICTITTIGIRSITKPMVKALNDLNATVKEINKEHLETKQRVADLETVHRLRGCNRVIEGD